MAKSKQRSIGDVQRVVSSAAWVERITGVTPHTLRHTYATRELQNKGITLSREP